MLHGYLGTYPGLIGTDTLARVKITAVRAPTWKPRKSKSRLRRLPAPPRAIRHPADTIINFSPSNPYLRFRLGSWTNRLSERLLVLDNSAGQQLQTEHHRETILFIILQSCPAKP